MSLVNDATAGTCIPTKTTINKCPFNGCGLMFVSKTKFMDHMNVYIGPKPFTCRGCGKAYSGRYKKLQQTYVCTRKKSESCHYCSRPLKLTTALQVHIKPKYLWQSYSCECGSFRIQQCANSTQGQTSLNRIGVSIRIYISVCPTFAFSEPSLVNLISKDANLVFYSSVYPLSHSSN